MFPDSLLRIAQVLIPDPARTMVDGKKLSPPSSDFINIIPVEEEAVIQIYQLLFYSPMMWRHRFPQPWSPAQRKVLH